MTDSWMSTGIVLILSLLGYFTIRKQSRMIYGISVVAFIIVFLLSFATFFTNLHMVNRDVVVEIIFVLALIVIRLSRGRNMKRWRSRNLMMKTF